ncbi:MAG TPA: hypothetical protein VF652_06725 [Allosphingosinicella sp.]|jgi:hypothetical protein
MINVNKLPTLDLEVGAEGSAKHSPVIVGQIAAGIVLGIIIAVSNPG